MSFYAKQYYEQAVETRDHAAANYYTHDCQAVVTTFGFFETAAVV